MRYAEFYLAITIKTDDNLLLKEMDYLRDFIGGFKECTFDTWGLYKDANQTHKVSILFVGLRAYDWFRSSSGVMDDC